MVPSSLTHSPTKSASLCPKIPRAYKTPAVPPAKIKTATSTIEYIFFLSDVLPSTDVMFANSPCCTGNGMVNSGGGSIGSGEATV